MLGSFAAELVAAQRSRNPSASLVLVPFVHSALIVAVVFVPSWIAWEYIWHPAAAFVPVFAATIVSLKLISFACVNSDMRREMRLRIRSRPVEDMTSFKPEPITSENGEKFHPSELQYPANLTLANFAYFAFAPTLCYQTSYPRTKRIRKVFLVKRVIELSTAIAGMYFLSVQYAGPTLRNSIEALDSMDVLRLSERILKLSIISVVIWLLMFWSLFHCWLNILAELLCFGDRRFYQPWWNAKDISEYWRLWNSPVYNWGKRHIYLPLILNCGVPPQAALAIVFCISALLHELLIAVPTHCFNGVAFLGMMGQVPLIIILNVVFGWCRRIFKRPKNDLLYDTIGNYIFWITFTIVGQPACVLLYYSQWYKKNAITSMPTVNLADPGQEPLNIYYQVCGTGSQHILFINGLGGLSHHWDDVAEYFVKLGDDTACLFDNRGVGMSSAPAGRYTTTLMARDASRLLNHLGWEHVHLVGVSLGGMIAQELALMLGDKVLSLTLESTYSKFNGVPFFAKRTAYSGQQTLVGRLGQTLAGTFHFCDRRLDDIRERGYPVLVIAGDDDRILIQPSSSKYLAERLGARLEIYKGGGHVLFLEDPEWHNALLLETVRKGHERWLARTAGQ
nr:hypothetical protein HK105_004952 [Polyrhizophydium stewartii]